MSILGISPSDLALVIRGVVRLAYGCPRRVVAVNTQYNHRRLYGVYMFMSNRGGPTFDDRTTEWPMLWRLSGTSRDVSWVGCRPWVSTFAGRRLPRR